MQALWIFITGNDIFKPFFNNVTDNTTVKILHSIIKILIKMACINYIHPFRLRIPHLVQNTTPRKVLPHNLQMFPVCPIRERIPTIIDFEIGLCISVTLIQKCRIITSFRETRPKVSWEIGSTLSDLWSSPN